MKNNVLSLTLAAVVGTAGVASADQLVIGTTGGDFAAALEDAFFKPFAAEKGIETIIVPGSTAELTALLRAQNQSGQVEFDLTTSNPQTVLTDPHLYEKLDCEGRIPNAKANGVEGTCTDLYLVRTIGATVVTYATEAFPNGGPTTWAEFFDTEKFPGKRCMMGNVETYTPFIIALLADGVEPENLYPFDYDRALNKLRELRPNISAYFGNYSMSQQLMRDGECVVSPMLDGRATSLRNEGFALSTSLDKGVASTGYWSIPKGAPNLNLAYDLLNYWMSTPENHVTFFKRTNYATAHASAAELLDEEARKSYAGTPENFAKILFLNNKWIAENDAEINRQYGHFLAGN